MDEQLRRSIWTKMSAIGFIYLIVLGNIWYAMLVVGAAPPEWLKISFYLGIFFVLASGAGLLMKILTRWYLNPYQGEVEALEDRSEPPVEKSSGQDHQKE